MDGGKVGEKIKLKSDFINWKTGKNVAILNKSDAEEIGVFEGSRIKVTHNKNEITAIVNTSSSIKKGTVIFSEEVKKILKINKGSEVEIEILLQPNSVKAIRDKLDGKELSYQEFFEIVKDVINMRLTDIEIAAFVIGLYEKGLSFEEAARLTTAMVEVGEKLELKSKRIFDKHSIGGVPGDKTTMLVVPIIASAGLVIPKTSSRAITSAAGTADRVEVLMPVTLSIEEMKEVVEKTNGCMVWGGGLHLSPADDIFIQYERPLSIDPLLFPSILSKKKSVGATDLVVDIPVGSSVKIQNTEEAFQLSQKFIKLGEELGIRAETAITSGEQPIGKSIGPALEAKEVLELFEGKGFNEDLVDKATSVAGILLEMAGKKNGKALARELLFKKAGQKFREIMEAQGGDPKLKSEDIKIGEKSFDYYAQKDGVVMWFDNYDLAETARIAGAPKDKGAGIRLYKKLGDQVKKGDKVLTVFAEKSTKLGAAEKYIEDHEFVKIGSYNEMLYKHVKNNWKKRRKFVIIR